jgi:hypothetical protein
LHVRQQQAFVNAALAAYSDERTGTFARPLMG